MANFIDPFSAAAAAPRPPSLPRPTTEAEFDQQDVDNVQFSQRGDRDLQAASINARKTFKFFWREMH
jgi:hypothetical protein